MQIVVFIRLLTLFSMFPFTGTEIWSVMVKIMEPLQSQKNLEEMKKKAHMRKSVSF